METQATDVPREAALDDPRALSILNAEHSSLLQARSLVYNEAFTRVGMFLTFLSATLVALGLVSTATGFDDTFLLVTALTFSVDLFLGLVTLGRLLDTGTEDLRYLAGMNRLRHAYHEMVPGLDRYFMSSRHDDAPGIMGQYGAPDGLANHGGLSVVLQGLKTMPAMVSVLCALLVAVLVYIIALLLFDSTLIATVAGCGAFVLAVAAAARFLVHGVESALASLRPEFPTPPPSPPVDR